jgi:shikimate kinase
MASGKSSVGRTVARLTASRFTDMDEEIENREHMPIHRIFSERGEVAFRNLETALLHELGDTCSAVRHIIATGGGTPCTGNNMDYMNERGITVYLKTSIEDVITRVGLSSTRPVFHRIGTREGLELLLHKREPYYHKAHVWVENSSNAAPEQLAEQIVRTLQL